MTRVFISYRRKDASADAGRIFDRLKARFGGDNVTLDVDSIPPGIDFRAYIRTEVSKCDVLLVIIGDRWLELLDTDPPDAGDTVDWAKFEIETALQRGIPVVPVLVGDAALASAADLPESIRDLSYRNAIEVRAGASFDGQVGRLLDGIEQTAAKPKIGGRWFRSLAATVAVTMAAAALAWVAWTYFDASNDGPVSATTAAEHVEMAAIAAERAIDAASDGRRTLSVVTRPAEQSVAVGQTARLEIRVTDNNTAVRGAKVTVTAGGGRFSAETTAKPTTASGLTNSNGSFSVAWACKTCAKAYRLPVNVSKDGYNDSTTYVIVRIER